jgi:hypothetical protein
MIVFGKVSDPGHDARNTASSDSSSRENNTGIISFIVNLPLNSFSARTSCWASGRPTGITILPSKDGLLVTDARSGCPKSIITIGAERCDRDDEFPVRGPTPE